MGTQCIYKYSKSKFKSIFGFSMKNLSPNKPSIGTVILLELAPLTYGKMVSNLKTLKGV